MARSGGPGAPSISPAAVGLQPWWHLISTRADGRPHPLIRNGKIAVENDPVFAFAIMLDTFSQEIVLLRSPPWDPNTPVPRPWNDNDDRQLAMWFQEFMLTLGPNQANEVIQTVANDNKFHPVQDHYNRLTWDNIPRLGDSNTPSWLTYYCGAKDDDYVRAIGARWMISAVARVFEPGCQADSVLILEGKTGLGKSSVFKILGGAWYTNHVAALSTTDASEQILGKHIIELDELDAMTRAGEWAAVLSFISRSTDHFRLKYGRRSGDFPRQCIFGGTTEKSEWLRDHSGHRRWWPVACGPKIDLPALDNDRDMLWAEAVARYKARERWWLHETTLIGQAADENQDRIESDVWEEKIVDFLALRTTAGIPEILSSAIGTPIDRQTDREKRRVTRVLRKLGWAKQEKNRMTGKISNLWVPVAKSESE